MKSLGRSFSFVCLGSFLVLSAVGASEAWGAKLEKTEKRTSLEKTASEKKDQAVLTPEQEPQATFRGTGQLSLGYMSRYEEHGLVVRSPYAQDGGLVFDSFLSASLKDEEGQSVEAAAKEGSVPFLALTYRDMKVGGSHGKVDFALGSQTIKEKIGEEGKRESYSSRFGYVLSRGGLSGVMADFKGGVPLLEGNKTVQEIAYKGRKSYNWGLESGGEQEFFTELSVSYAFGGLTGWKMGAQMGWMNTSSEYVGSGLIFYALWSASYWGAVSGMDSMGLTYQVYVKWDEYHVLTPFVDVGWGGRSVKVINRKVQADLLENFAVVAGVKLSIDF